MGHIIESFARAVKKKNEDVVTKKKNKEKKGGGGGGIKKKKWNDTPVYISTVFTPAFF